MSNPVKLITRDEQKALVIRDQVSTLKLPKVMGPAYMKIAEYMKKKGAEPTEAPFTSYKVDNWDEAINIKGLKAIISLFTKKWDIEMGFPLTEDVPATDSIEISTLLGGEYIQILHVGPYQKVGDTYKKIYQYVQEHNLVLDNQSYEFYRNDPRDTPKDKLETLVLIHVTRQ
jgi:AraC family transcriptional regulator